MIIITILAVKSMKNIVKNEQILINKATMNIITEIINCKLKNKVAKRLLTSPNKLSDREKERETVKEGTMVV